MAEYHDQYARNRTAKPEYPAAFDWLGENLGKWWRGISNMAENKPADAGEPAQADKPAAAQDKPAAEQAAAVAGRDKDGKSPYEKAAEAAAGNGIAAPAAPKPEQSPLAALAAPAAPAAPEKKGIKTDSKLDKVLDFTQGLHELAGDKLPPPASASSPMVAAPLMGTSGGELGGLLAKQREAQKPQTYYDKFYAAFKS